MKSLYGLRQTQRRTFIEKLREGGLLERGYVQSDNNPCLFMKKGILMCIMYVDDTIFAGVVDSDLLEEEICTTLGSAGLSNERHTFQLRYYAEGEVGAFLGIQITTTGERTFELTHTGLIAKVLETAQMLECNGVDIPTGSVPVGNDTVGPPFAKAWNYRTIVGMLIFLSANTRPDISYAITLILWQSNAFSPTSKQQTTEESRSRRP